MAVDVEQLSKELIYRAQAPCARVLEELRQLGELDTLKEKQQSQALTVSVATLGGGLSALYVGFSTLGRVFGAQQLLSWSGAALLLVSSVAFVIRTRHRRLNLENRRYELASHVVGLLQADISPEEPVTLELDLRPDTHSDKYRDESKTPSGWTVKHYLDPWLSLQGRLLDGTHLRLEMAERVQLRKRTKTNFRGKTKFQSKRLSDALLRVRLRVKPERYQHLRRLGSQAKGAVQLLKGTRLKALTLEADRVDMTLLLESPWLAVREPRPDSGRTSTDPLDGPRVVAMALLSLYQILNLSRALDKKAVHPPRG